MITKGIYRHWKGGLYRVVGTATHTETGEEMVVYTSEDGKQWFVRPAGMWKEEIRPGVRRFCLDSEIEVRTIV